jgi:hypothetical protein
MTILPFTPDNAAAVWVIFLCFVVTVLIAGLKHQNSKNE